MKVEIKKNKENTINLEINENQCDLLTAMLQVVGHEGFAELLKKLDIVKDGLDFVDQLSAKSHKEGWCKDPDCEDKKK